MPTAPEIFPTLTTSRARSTRVRARPSSACHRASFSPKVIGSACTPWVRPIIGVSRCSRARSATAATAPSSPARISPQASRICSASAVSRTSEDVSPKCSQRAEGPTCSATAVVNAMTSCCVVRSISSTRSARTPGHAAMSRTAASGTSPVAAIASAAVTSTRSQVSYLRWSLQMRPISGFV